MAKSVPPPESFQKAVIAVLWHNTFGRITLIFGIAVVSILSLVPSDHRTRALDWALSQLEPTENLPDVIVRSFAVADESDQEVNWLRVKVERKFVELFTDAGHRVSHQLSVANGPVGSKFVLAGEITKNGDQISIASTFYQDGLVVASAELVERYEVLEEIFSQFADGLLLAMDLDPRLLKVRGSSKQPTLSATSLALFLAAQKEATAKRFEKANALLDKALENDPSFAMALWARGELQRLSGNSDAAADYKLKAKTLDPDHPKWPIALNVGNPLPALFDLASGTSWKAIAEGLKSKELVLEDYDLAVHVWSFDPLAYTIDLALQTSARGSTATELREAAGGIIAVNGGFFEIDPEDRLWPSGLLIKEGREIQRYVEEAGSGVLVVRDGKIGIGWSRDGSTYSGAATAVQSGPLVVEPGGSNGIYSNDFDRRERTAICLTGDHQVVLLVATGTGLSLFELGDFLSRGFGCERALNLDGGASTQYSFANNGVTLDEDGVWKIHNAVVVKKSK